MSRAMRSNPTLSRAEAMEQFVAAMRCEGVETNHIIEADGRLHRFHVVGDRNGSANGWYVLYLGGVPGGAFGSWKAGVSGTWRADIGRRLSRRELAADRSRVIEARILRDAEHANLRASCCDRAERLWRDASAADAGHGYLLQKGIGPNGARLLSRCLLIPVLDVIGQVHGLQFIAADGSKRFLTGTAKTGCFYPLADLPVPACGTLAIVEGFATAATVKAATGWPTVAAFDACNLLPVASALKAVHPDAGILICADNDRHTSGNPGLSRGRMAAAAVGGAIVAPSFREGDDGTDWNDYAMRYGLAATAYALRSALTGAGHDA